MRVRTAFHPGVSRFVGALLLLLLLIVALPEPARGWQDADAAPASESQGDGLRAPGKPVPEQVPGLPMLSGSGDLSSIPTRLSEMFRAGGVIMWPIALCSVIAFTFALERLVVLRRRRVIPRDFVRRFLQNLEQGELDRETASQLCEQNGSPIAEVFLHGVRKWGKPSVEVEQAIIDGGERQIGHLRKHLRILNAVATLTPLLGLLGTVIGMIQCFNQIATSSAMGKSEQLAGGIGVALLTTAFGLGVAIPSLMLYMYFAGRIDALVMEMDSLAQRVVELISAEAIAERSVQSPRGGPPRPKGLVSTPGKAG
ncbi:MAG: MotA/TolQ/ExbB proton channel family protein [Planctomycetaceae bacterium]